MRPTSAFSASIPRSCNSTYNIVGSNQRPKSVFTTRHRVLTANSTAYKSWLRRSNEYSFDSGIPGHPREYKSVQTFNLRDGCKLTRSESRLQVRLDPDEFFEAKIEKTKELSMKPADMEILIKTLQEQVKYLTLYLEEERLHHAGTKKRGKVDLEKSKKEMEKSQGEEMERVLKNHMKYVEDIKEEHAQQMQDLQQELQQQYKKLETEYKQLQASFKNYRVKISEEMSEKWKSKLSDFEWEKKRAVDNAVDNMRSVMEQRFMVERAEIRKEYKDGMQQLVDDQRLEMEDFMRKMSDGKSSINELKAKADKADALEAALQELEEKYQTTNKELKRMSLELQETQSNLNVYERKFEEKVDAVEDKYRKRIDDLIREVSELRLKFIDKCDSLYQERYKAEEDMQRRTNIIKDMMIARDRNKQFKGSVNGLISVEIKREYPTDGSGDSNCGNLPCEKESQLPQSKTLIGQPDSKYSGELLLENNKHLISETSDQKTGVTFSLPPRKHKWKKLDKNRNDRGVEQTLAGPDKIRPRVTMTTVSLLETANLPFTEDHQSNEDRTESARSPSPDIIY